MIQSHSRTMTAYHSLLTYFECNLDKTLCLSIHTSLQQHCHSKTSFCGHSTFPATVNQGTAYDTLIYQIYSR